MLRVKITPKDLFAQTWGAGARCCDSLANGGMAMLVARDLPVLRFVSWWGSFGASTADGVGACEPDVVRRDRNGVGGSAGGGA